MTRILYLLIASILLIGTAAAYTVDGYDTYYTDGGHAYLRAYGTAPPGEVLRCVIDGPDTHIVKNTAADKTTRYEVTFPIPPGKAHYTVGIYTGYKFRAGMGARVDLMEAPWLSEGIKGIRPPPVPPVMKITATPTPAPGTQADTPEPTPTPTMEPTPSSSIRVQPPSNTTTLNISSQLGWDSRSMSLVPQTPQPFQEQDHELNNNLWIACGVVCLIGVVVYIFRE